MSSFYDHLPEKIEFEDINFKKEKTEKYKKDYSLKDMLSWGVIDYNRF